MALITSTGKVNSTRLCLVQLEALPLLVTRVINPTKLIIALLIILLLYQQQDVIQDFEVGGGGGESPYKKGQLVFQYPVSI